MDDDPDLREQIFHNTVRENIVSKKITLTPFSKDDEVTKLVIVDFADFLVAFLTSVRIQLHSHWPVQKER